MKADELVKLLDESCHEDFTEYDPNAWEQAEHNMAYYVKEKGLKTTKEIQDIIKAESNEVLDAVFGETLAEKLNAYMECPIDSELDNQIEELVNQALIKDLSKCVPSIEDKVNELGA